jgi:excisionase family DNA binding protein
VCASLLPMDTPTMTTPLDEVFAPYPDVLSVEQVAALLGRSTRDTYRRLESRELPVGRKEGAKWLIYKAELRAYLDAL